MTHQLNADDVRAIVLDEVKKLVAQRGGSARAFGATLAIERACDRANSGGRPGGDLLVLESFHTLFNEGVLSWGMDRANLGPTWAHVTALGVRVLADLDRDPANGSGYLAELRRMVDPDGLAWGYLVEAVHSYNSGCDRGAAVLLGCAAEALVLDVRDALITRLAAEGVKASGKLTDWKAKPVIDEIDRLLRGSATKMPHELFERFDAHWRALFHHVRMARNEAGHPASVRPIERSAVHGSLLLFPALARLAYDLRA